MFIVSIGIGKTHQKVLVSETSTQLVELFVENCAFNGNKSAKSIWKMRSQCSNDLSELYL
ncbi:hypothetical protein EGR_01306 [Echinococcus granulosus]|uniref:Uncharacterized protein n=1 Tax=Echinococcus granulosus TaxID=6210 RepID=W6UR37_ECHGR|nr:hypothetical protein EGR_01306 [Echinococcus granulosus]EUB63683.1 hypothetical protein EGR_01306 [Echinococcus granulosus]